MSIPKNCSNCGHFRSCDSAMYYKGCHYFPPREVQEKRISLLIKLIGKFFK